MIQDRAEGGDTRTAPRRREVIQYKGLELWMASTSHLPEVWKPTSWQRR